MKPILLVGLGGGLGSILRYLLHLYTTRYFPLAFPLGTLLVNVAGCFLIGLLFGLTARHSWMSYEWRLLLITGLCGGFTTFSSFSIESVNLLQQDHYAAFLLYLFLSIGLGLGATVAGTALVR